MSSTMAHEKFDSASRRAGVRRTAWTLALLAVAVFVGFVLHVTLR